MGVLLAAPLLSAIISLLPVLPARSEPAPVNNWAEFRAAMAACWTVPPDIASISLETLSEWLNRLPNKVASIRTIGVDTSARNSAEAGHG